MKDIKKCYAIKDGYALVVGNKGAYGLRVYIRHNDKTTLLYAHLASTELKQGDRVKAGDEVGVIGNSGYSKGIHLHTSFFNPGCLVLNSRNAVDPMPYFKEHGYPCTGKITNEYGSDICNPNLPRHEGVDFSAKTKRINTKKKKVVKND